MKIKKKAMWILTLSKYNSYTEPLFRKLHILKIDDLLKLHELKFYLKYMHQKLPAYLLNWKIIPNIHNHSTTDIYLFRAKHEFVKKVS